MPTTLTATITEQGTAIITVTCADENGDAVNPDSLTWSLVDRSGNAINSRKDVSISSPTSSEDIVLSGDDLVVPDGYDSVKRWVVIEGTYSSDAGSGLPLRDQCEFTVTNLKKVRS